MSGIPEIKVPKAMVLPDVETLVLGNGLSVHLIETEGQDVARVSFVWAAGSSVGDKPFVASSTLNLLAEGSRDFTAKQIAEKLDFLGSYYEVSLDRDYAVMTFCCLEKFFDQTLEMMHQIVLGPVFPVEEVEIYTRKRMERLALERAKPAVKAREAFSASLFGEDHPYGESFPESAYKDVKREDVEEFYRRFYGAENCFVVCSIGSGKREKLTELLESREFGAWSRETKVKKWAVKSKIPQKFIPVEGAVQSAIRIGRVLFSREHHDFVGMQVVATILGGYFGSRLVKVLREERGYTYGVMAAMVNLKHAGYLAIATEVAAQYSSQTIDVIFEQMERLKTELISEDELENVKRSMLGEVARILDGPFGIVDVVIENIQVGRACGRQVNYLEEFIREVEEITPARIRLLARKYLVRDEFVEVVVGGEQV